MSRSSPSFDDFVVARGADLLRFAYLLTQDRGRAEDLVQESLIKAHRRWNGRTRVEQPDAYARRIVVNEFVSWRRRRLNTEAPGPITDAPRSDPTDQVIERDAVWRALATLPSRQRAVLVLRYYEDLNDQEISLVLDCAEGTVRSLMSRASKALRSNPSLAETHSASWRKSVEESL